ncbi:DNA-3-methyladenine glycosylase family protein [Arthrobacter wenxiniae]|jgi:AraC family transcriptional regulator of adaptative response / DNA-3-methyladenine glycosylase II|uniref:DNA-3-methyladenine glycosylase II n=1 Tax=Arthrobacter wenxiniae TaxID=2713570 RepID=A0A7Y7IGV5_9MICC|nr:DNA-3-methyladenine glycosylase 2 family protein [Arthrobacter wenxiniae]NVM95256.1 DNA-3-methyladenine glycosylase 2 family protein [Arthrobacter wenxiniae]
MRHAEPFLPPFEPGIFDFLAARAVAGVEEATPRSYARTLSLPGGHGWFRLVRERRKLLLDYSVEDAADAPVLAARVRHLFDLDHDPASADAALAADPLLARRVAALPGIRLPGCVDPHEILIRAMIGQQITVAAATTALRQLMAVGTPTRLPHGSMTHLFPTPSQIAADGRSILRGPQRRIDSILAVAGMLGDGSLTIGVQDTPESLAEKLLPLPGIGPWTVGYVCMRVLGSSDIFLPTDSAVRNGYGLLRGDSLAAARAIKAPELARMAEPLRPWRSYATLHFWRVSGERPSGAARR